MNIFNAFSSSQRIKKVLTAIVFVIMALFFGSLTNKALAFNTNAPVIGQNSPQSQSADVISGPTGVQPWMSVGEGAYEGRNSYAKVYVPVGTGANLTIHNGGGYCEINGTPESLDVNSPGTGVGAYPNVRYEIWNLSDQELWSTGTPPPAGYNNPSAAAGTLANSLGGGNTNCRDLTLSFPSGIASVYIGHTGYKVYYFEADMINPDCTQPGVCDTEKNFKLSINNGGLIGFSRKMRDYPVNEFGVYFRNAPNLGGNNWNFATFFAPRCDENPSGSKSVTVKDIDWNVPGYTQPNLSGLVNQDNRNDGNFNWTLAPPGQPSSKKVSNDWPSGNNTTANLTFNINNHDHKYLLEFRDIYFRNTIQIQIPYDQFDAGVQSCAPSVSCTTNPGSQNITAGSSANIGVTGSISSGQWPSSYYLRRYANPQHNYADISSPGSNNGTDTVTPPATDTYIYFVASNNTNETTNGLVGGPVFNGTTCQATVIVSTGTVKATCTPLSGSTEVGQNTTFNFAVNVVNTTPSAVTVINGSTPPPDGSITNITAPNPLSKIINPPGASDTFSITALVNSSGTLTATVTYNGTVIANCPYTVTAVAMPYVQAWNGSVSAGGGFRSPGIKDTGSCGGTSSDPPYYSPARSGNQNTGGIETFGKQSATRGSRTDFGALAMGTITGNPGGPTGFYSGDISAGTRPVFSNNPLAPVNYLTGSMGGYLNGNTGHCASDFYSNTMVDPNNTTPEQGSLSADIANCQSQSTGNRCQFAVPSPETVLNIDVPFPAGYQITIYSDHDVTISGDLAYNSFDATQQNNVPYFALIVRGNITVASSVTRLDGLYVAQPQPPTPPSTTWAGGTFATCQANVICNSQLVVNGAVIAQEVDLLRNHGTLSGGDPKITGNPAEVFNFTPSMIIGLPAFGATSITPEGVFSLPPVF